MDREHIKIHPIKVHHHGKLSSSMSEEVEEYKFKKPGKLEDEY